MSYALGICPSCGFAIYLTKAGVLARHMPDGRKNDGGVVPPQPRCPGSGQPGTPVERTVGR
jgi:hypothetical protein